MGVAAALAETAGCVLCRCTFQSCHVSRVNLTCVTCAPGQGVCEVDVPVLRSVLYNKVRHFDSVWLHYYLVLHRVPVRHSELE